MNCKRLTRKKKDGGKPNDEAGKAQPGEEDQIPLQTLQPLRQTSLTGEKPSQ